MREVCRRNLKEIGGGKDIIIIARSKFLEYKHDEIRELILESFKEINRA